MIYAKARLNLNMQLIKEELDRIDKILTYTMNVVWKNIEGLNRTVPFSMKKLISHTKILFWKLVKLQAQGKAIDRELMRRRADLLEINIIEIEQATIEEKIKQAEEK